MKRTFYFIGLIALAVAGVCMLVLIKSKDHGKENAQNDSETSGSAIEETREEGSEEAGTGINS